VSKDPINCFFCKGVLLKKSLVIIYLICSLLFTLCVSYLLHYECEVNVSSSLFEDKPHYNISLFIGLSGLFLNSLLFLALLAYLEKRKLLKEEHEILLKSEHRLEAILSSFADGIHILDSDGNLIDYSNSFIESLGYSEKEADDLRVSRWDCNFSEGELHQILASKIDEERVFETRHRRKDGTVFDVEVTLKPMMSEGKSYIYCSSKNITERKKRLEELALFHSLIDDSDDMIFIIRMEDGYIEYANKTAEEDIGYTLTEMRSMGVEGFRRPLKEGKLFSDHLQELKAAGKLVDHSIIVRKDGSEFLVEAHVRASHYLGTDYNIAIASDITQSEEYKEKLEILTKELQEREEKLQEINTHLNQRIKEESAKLFEKEKILIQQSKMAAMGEMIGMIAHQWRQPLNAVSAATIKLDMLSKMEVLAPEELSETLTFIQEMSQKMSRTINDFMDFSKPDRKKESVDIKNVFEGIMKIIEAQFTTRSISITIDIEEGIRINAYKHELSHALMNCLSNARDAFENKEIANKAIRIRVYDEEENVVIEIGDNAGGIEPSILERIFEPFFTTKATDKGTGLGLYMSKKMIEEDFNGTIEVMNKNDGALFVIKLLKTEIE